MKTILAAVAILALSSTSALAATTFDFLSGPNGAVGWTNGSLNYSADGIDLGVSAGRYSSGSVSDSGSIRQYNGHGLAIYSSGGDSNHEIDGRKKNDVAVFDFSKSVTLESVTFTSKYNTNEDRFAFFFDTGDDGSLNLINSSLNANPTDTYSFLGGLLKTGDLFGIGAIGKYHDFKIASMTVSVSAVPLPAALPLYGAGMAVLGFIGYRRKKKQTASA